MLLVRLAVSSTQLFRIRVRAKDPLERHFARAPADSLPCWSWYRMGRSTGRGGIFDHTTCGTHYQHTGSRRNWLDYCNLWYLSIISARFRYFSATAMGKLVLRRKLENPSTTPLGRRSLSKMEVILELLIYPKTGFRCQVSGSELRDWPDSRTWRISTSQSEHGHQVEVKTGQNHPEGCQGGI